jgi:hypothetical protein
MKDIDIAKTKLNEEKLSLIIVKNGSVLYKSDRRGIYPLYMAVKECGPEMEGTSAADKVVGRGAALLYQFMKVKSIYAYLISEGTREVLVEGNIEFETEKTAPYIKNRDGTGMCPVETLSYETENLNQLMLSIEGFLRKINLI